MTRNLAWRNEDKREKRNGRERKRKGRERKRKRKRKEEKKRKDQGVREYILNVTSVEELGTRSKNN